MANLHGREPILCDGRLAPTAVSGIPNLGPRISMLDHEGKLIGRFGEMPAGTEFGKFLAPHRLPG